MSTLIKHRIWISPITGVFGVDNRLRSLIVSPAGAIQNQHTRKSSSLAKDSKQLRNDKDQEDFEKTGELESRKRPGMCLRSGENRHRHAFTSWHDLGLSTLLSFLPSS